MVLRVDKMRRETVTSITPAELSVSGSWNNFSTYDSTVRTSTVAPTPYTYDTVERVSRS